MVRMWVILSVRRGRGRFKRSALISKNNAIIGSVDGAPGSSKHQLVTAAGGEKKEKWSETGFSQRV
jgi:hypothetical protein